MAQTCGYDDSHIYKFEEGTRGLDEIAFERYVEALMLTPRQSGTQILRNLYEGSLLKDKIEVKLELYNFELTTQNKNLNTLVKTLGETHFPGFIVDDLWYIHAFNQPIVRLFNLREQHLRHPFIWHVIATKYWPESPVRKAHKGVEGIYFPHILRQFYKAISPYFFTQQVRQLQNLLCQLSTEFQNHWDGVVRLAPWYEMTGIIRNIWYGADQSQWVITYADRVEIEVENIYTLGFSLAYWQPHDPRALKIWQNYLAPSEEVKAEPPVFATEYHIPYGSDQWFKFLP
jgi:hypothetical protein